MMYIGHCLQPKQWDQRRPLGPAAGPIGVLSRRKHLKWSCILTCLLGLETGVSDKVYLAPATHLPFTCEMGVFSDKTRHKTEMEQCPVTDSSSVFDLPNHKKNKDGAS